MPPKTESLKKCSECGCPYLRISEIAFAKHGTFETLAKLEEIKVFCYECGKKFYWYPREGEITARRKR